MAFPTSDIAAMEPMLPEESSRDLEDVAVDLPMGPRVKPITRPGIEPGHFKDAFGIAAEFAITADSIECVVDCPLPLCAAKRPTQFVGVLARAEAPLAPLAFGPFAGTGGDGLGGRDQNPISSSVAAYSPSVCPPCPFPDESAPAVAADSFLSNILISLMVISVTFFFWPSRASYSRV